jgi:hypothetical protein
MVGEEAMKTCGDCFFYEPAGMGRDGRGEPAEVGTCFGAPPTVTPTGSTPPIVGKIRRACALFQPKPKRKASK